PSRFDEVRHRQIYSMGHFITREDFELKKPRHTSDMLRTQLGLEIGEDLGHVTIFSTRGATPSFGASGFGPQVAAAAGRRDSTASAEARTRGQQTQENVLVRCVIPIVLDSRLMPPEFSIDD